MQGALSFEIAPAKSVLEEQRRGTSGIRPGNTRHDTRAADIVQDPVRRLNRCPGVRADEPDKSASARAPRYSPRERPWLHQ
jgi:hypothetical protein